MTVGLDRLPFDILYHVTSFLAFDDVVHLAYTCGQLKALLDENTLCRKAIEKNFLYSKEAQLAQEKSLTYGEALKCVYDRRSAFSSAHPFSACIVGQGTEFTYRQGVLCVLNGTTISVQDLHGSSKAHPIDISPIINSVSESSSASPSELKISLLYYSDEIITVLYERKGRANNGRILAISTKASPPGGNQLIKEILLESSYKIFARHTSRYLYYGTYTAMGDHGHHEWELHGVVLDGVSRLPKCERPLQLEEFFGTDIGSTITFEIHGNYFYAISNQTSFDVEELDWTSFYHCIRFPLDRPVRDALEINPRVYRRQHAEGPIHDSWTDLTLQSDECTNEPMIVESRREWQNGSSRQLRTFYISKIKFHRARGSGTPSSEASPTIGSSNGPLLPSDDPFTTLLDSSNNPHYAPTQPRFNWNFHPEIPPGCTTSRSFILARTKFRAYNYSCSSFLDLVEDERCCNNPLAGPCLRIRVGSRRVAPLHYISPDKITFSKDKSTDPPVAEDDLMYRHSSIKMWPPPASKCPCSKRLHDILNPPLQGAPAHNRSISAVLDERSLVYLVRPGRSYGSGSDNTSGSIVFINFSQGPLPPRSDSISQNDHERHMEDEFNPSHWQWMTGHSAHCRNGTCR